MIKRPLFVLYVIPSLLLFLSIFVHSHLNWKEHLFLFILMSLYAVDLIFRKIIQGLNHYLLPFLLIFLLSQFYINNFHPGNIGWWFGLIPGWLTFLITFEGFVSLVSYQKIRWDNRSAQTSNQSFPNLIHKAAPGIILVSLAMFFLFFLNFDEISPQEKLVPDYSIYMIIALGFVLFYSLNFSHKFVSLNLKNYAIFLKTAPLAILIFLVGIGAVKIYLVYANYHHALHVKSEEKLWHDLLELNRVSRIKYIDARALAELGKINMKKENLKQASIYYEKFLTYQTFDFEANLALAEMAYQQKEWRKACEAYKRTLYLKPGKREVYFPFVHSCGKGGKVDEAMEFIGHLKENHPIPSE
jgi:tetratricopeptide (TPR) repeat protein